MRDRARGVRAAQPRRDEAVGNGVEIGHDVALDPRLERAVPVERQVQFLAIVGHQREAQQRAAPAIIFGVEEVPQRWLRPRRNCRSGAAGPCGSAPRPARSWLAALLLRLAHLAAALLVGLGLAGGRRVDPGRDDLHRQGDDIDRGLGDRADDAAGQEPAAGRVTSKRFIAPRLAEMTPSDYNCIASSASASACVSSASSASAPGRQRFAADDDHQRHRHRRDPVGLDMDHGRRRAVDQPDQAAELGHPPPRIVPRRAQQQMLGLVAAQHVVDEVGREADLPPVLRLPGMLALDQPADHRHLAEGASSAGSELLDPVDELLLEDVGREQRLAGRVIGSSP